MELVPFEMASVEEENGAEGSVLSVLAQLHCEDGNGGRVGSAMQKTGPETVSDMAKNSSTWTVTTTEPPPTSRQAGSSPGPITIGSGRLLLKGTGVMKGNGVIKGRVEMPTLDAEGITTVLVATGGVAVMVVGPAPMHEQALSNRYATSP